MNNREIEELDFEDWPLPSEYLTELGRVATLWGILEGQIDLYTAKLAGFNEIDADPRGYTMVSYATFPTKVKFIEEFCEFLKNAHPHLADYGSVVAALNAAAKARNRLFHNSLNYDVQKGELTTTNSRGKAKWTIEKVAKADIRKVAMSIHKAMIMLHGLVTGVKYPLKWERGDT